MTLVSKRLCPDLWRTPSYGTATHNFTVVKGIDKANMLHPKTQKRLDFRADRKRLSIG